MSHDIVVLRDGRVVEQGPAEKLFAAPQDPYTQALLSAAFELKAVETGVVSM